MQTEARFRFSFLADPEKIEGNRNIPLNTRPVQKDWRKRAIKRGLKIELLEQVVALLAMGEPLPDKNRDHDLSGDWAGHRECHIHPTGCLWMVFVSVSKILILSIKAINFSADFWLCS